MARYYDFLKQSLELNNDKYNDLINSLNKELQVIRKKADAVAFNDKYDVGKDNKITVNPIDLRLNELKPLYVDCMTFIKYYERLTALKIENEQIQSQIEAIDEEVAKRTPQVQEDEKMKKIKEHLHQHIDELDNLI